MKRRRPCASARIASGTFAEVIRAYQASPKFQSLRPSTQYRYRAILRVAERPETLGAIKVEELRPSLVQGFLDGLTYHRTIPVVARAVLKAVEKWAIRRDMLSHSITTGTEVEPLEGHHEPWPDDLVEIAEEYAAPFLSRVVSLMVHTGQRGSDIVKMRWGDITEVKDPFTGQRVAGINLTQQKTQKRLWVPISDQLAEKIETWKPIVMPPFLVLDPRGRPLNRNRLSLAWNRERDTNKKLAKLKEAGLVLHGLRATCVVRLRRRRATDLQIANMIGMSEPMVARYSRQADQAEMALAAIYHLNTGSERERRAKLEKQVS